jgi:hypothetical protein
MADSFWEFSEEIKASVWQLRGKSSLMDEFGFDFYNSPMLFSDYCNSRSAYSWEISYITCPADGGKKVVENLRPINCRNRKMNHCSQVERG